MLRLLVYVVTVEHPDVRNLYCYINKFVKTVELLLYGLVIMSEVNFGMDLKDLQFI